jgi:hypothetical protein
MADVCRKHVISGAMVASSRASLCASEAKYRLHNFSVLISRESVERWTRKRAAIADCECPAFQHQSLCHPRG